MATITLYTNKDAYVNQASPGTNYGSATLLRIVSPGYSNEQNALFGFDISSLAGTTINSATLYLFVNLAGGSGYSDIFSRITDNSWTESGVIWNNRPAWTPTNEVIVGMPTYGWVAINIKNMLIDQLTAGGNDFSVRGRTQTTYGTHVYIYAREYGYEAYINIDYTPGCTTYNDVYIDKFGGNDTSCGATDLTPVQTFTKAYNDRLNSNGNIHILNISPAADFSAQSLTMTKGFSMDLNGGSGTFYWPVWL